MQAAVDNLHKLLKSVIEEHRQRFVPGSVPQDYIDAYLQQIDECDNPKSSFYRDEGGMLMMCKKSLWKIQFPHF